MAFKKPGPLDPLFDGTGFGQTGGPGDTASGSSSVCGWDGGSASTQGTDTWEGGASGSQGVQQLDASIVCNNNWVPPVTFDGFENGSGGGDPTTLGSLPASATDGDLLFGMSTRSTSDSAQNFLAALNSYTEGQKGEYTPPAIDVHVNYIWKLYTDGTSSDHPSWDWNNTGGTADMAGFLLRGPTSVVDPAYVSTANVLNEYERFATATPTVQSVTKVGRYIFDLIHVLGATIAGSNTLNVSASNGTALGTFYQNGGNRGFAVVQRNTGAPNPLSMDVNGNPANITSVYVVTIQCD